MADHPEPHDPHALLSDALAQTLATTLHSWREICDTWHRLRTTLGDMADQEKADRIGQHIEECEQKIAELERQLRDIYPSLGPKSAP